MGSEAALPVETAAEECLPILQGEFGPAFQLQVPATDGRTEHVHTYIMAGYDLATIPFAGVSKVFFMWTACNVEI